MKDENFPIALSDDAKARISVVADEQNESIYEVIRVFAEESALRYFRGRSDDPGVKHLVPFDTAS